MNGKQSILIIDDDPGLRKTLSDILKIKGYASIAVDRGKIALEVIEAEQPPVVALIDLKLEDMSGLELMRKIKASSPDTECILLTGHASQSSAIEAVNLGAYGYMQKPYAIDQLLVMIHRAIEKHQAETALQRVAEQRQRLLQTAQAILATLAVDEVLQQVRQSLKEVLTYDDFRLYWLDKESKALLPSLNHSAETPLSVLSEARFPLGRDILSVVAQTGEGELVNNVYLDSRPLFPGELVKPGKHAICLPIRTEAKTTGVLLVSRQTDPPFTAEEFQLAQLFTSYVSLAIANARFFEQTQLSEKRYRTLFEESKDAIYIVAVDGKFIDVNPAAVELFGCQTREELLHMPVKQFIQLSPADEQKFRQALAVQGFLKDFEFVVHRKDHQHLTMLGTTSVVRNEKGDIIAHQTIGRDITERKQLELQLRQSQKMEAIGRLAGGVAHDFNNLLTVIGGYSGLLLDLHVNDDDPQRKDIEQIRQASERAAGLTRQLLAFSRQQVLQPKVLSLNEVVSNLEKMLRRLISEDIDLTTVLGENLGKVKADPGQMEQVIINLVINARDAIMPYGGKLIIETSNVALDQSYARRYVNVTPGQYVMLVVSDTGQGMDEDTQSHIFEPFFSTKEPGRGTGLGLATVHGIVSQSGGHIWVYSEPGHGTIFKIYLPQIEEIIEPMKATTIQLERLPTTEIILLVEDNDMVRDFAQTVLEVKGYKVLVASQGSEAIDLCRRYQGIIDLLVTDVVMPGGISGRQLAEQLLPLRPNLKVLYMSGYTDDAIVHHGVLDLGKAFLQKPFTPNMLTHKVREVLDAKPEAETA